MIFPLPKIIIDIIWLSKDTPEKLVFPIASNLKWLRTLVGAIARVGPFLRGLKPPQHNLLLQWGSAAISWIRNRSKPEFYAWMVYERWRLNRPLAVHVTTVRRINGNIRGDVYGDDLRDSYRLYGVNLFY